MTDIGDWTLTKHAVQRALDMAVDAEELRDILCCPKRTWRSDKYEGCWNLSNGRITLAVDPDTRDVITVLWDSLTEVGRFDRNIEQDIHRIRD